MRDLPSRVSSSLGFRAIWAIAAAMVITAALTESEPLSAHQGAAVAVRLSDFNVDPGAGAEVAGEVAFVVRNQGGTEHEFVVVRTELAPDALPLAQDGSQVDESQLDVVAKIEPFGSGETRTVTANLSPGNYVLLCNIPGHYQLGMRVAFTVTAPQPPAPAEEFAASTSGRTPGGDGGGLPAGAWVGLALASVLAVLLILLSFPYILPRPPRR